MRSTTTSGRSARSSAAESSSLRRSPMIWCAPTRGPAPAPDPTRGATPILVVWGRIRVPARAAMKDHDLVAEAIERARDVGADEAGPADEKSTHSW